MELEQRRALVRVPLASYDRVGDDAETDRVPQRVPQCLQRGKCGLVRRAVLGLPFGNRRFRLLLSFFQGRRRRVRLSLPLRLQPLFFLLVGLRSSS